MIIINADDFGLNTQTNKAIIKSFESMLCSSTTLMPNMPGFEEACELAHQHKLINHVGFHLVLTGGQALTEKIKQHPRFFDDERGQLCLSPGAHCLHLTNAEKEALAEEIRAQLKRCQDYGIPITHLDSHRHIHTRWAITNVLFPILRKKRIPYIRLSCNIRGGTSLLKRTYKSIYNTRLKRWGFARTKFFISIYDYDYFKEKTKLAYEGESVEVMVHPMYSDEGQLINLGDKIPLKDRIKAIDSYQNAVSFSNCRHF